MKIVFYYTPFCPRSYFSLKNFKKVNDKTGNGGFTLKKTLFITRKGKKLFPPVIESDSGILSGFYLSEDDISNFLE